MRFCDCFEKSVGVQFPVDVSTDDVFCFKMFANGSFGQKKGSTKITIMCSIFGKRAAFPFQGWPPTGNAALFEGPVFFAKIAICNHV